MPSNLNIAPSMTGNKRESRREAMLRAAEQLFIDRGYDATTLNDVVRSSGGSLATLYDLFENKPGLLRALVSERCCGLGGAFDEAQELERPPAEVLRAIGQEMLDKLLDPNFVGLFRLVIAQSVTHPELGVQLFEAGPAVSQGKGATYLAKLNASGALDIPDPMAASRLFYEIVCGAMKTQIIFGMPVLLSEVERQRHLDGAVAAFLRIFEAVPGKPA